MCNKSFWWNVRKGEISQKIWGQNCKRWKTEMSPEQYFSLFSLVFSSKRIKSLTLKSQQMWLIWCWSYELYSGTYTNLMVQDNHTETHTTLTGELSVFKSMVNIVLRESTLQTKMRVINFHVRNIAGVVYYCQDKNDLNRETRQLDLTSY